MYVEKNKDELMLRDEKGIMVFDSTKALVIHKWVNRESESSPYYKTEILYRMYGRFFLTTFGGNRTEHAGEWGVEELDKSALDLWTKLRMK